MICSNLCKNKNQSYPIVSIVLTVSLNQSLFQVFVDFRIKLNTHSSLKCVAIYCYNMLPILSCLLNISQNKWFPHYVGT